mmetsp:Transcript_6595/g.26903  ORF Transcript_6595/g.26903 Transcript_6595/m.26903 type:complete len:135 (-) Transcript_6595:1419-1823(-)
MWSAWRTVDRRCAMTSTVLFVPAVPCACIALSSAACTSAWLSGSSAEVASSSSSSRGSRTSARAIAMRCFCPPLRVFALTIVSYPSGSLSMKSLALAARAASRTCASVASAQPYRMFSRTLVSKSWGSCDTTEV